MLGLSWMASCGTTTSCQSVATCQSHVFTSRDHQRLIYRRQLPCSIQVHAAALFGRVSFITLSAGTHLRLQHVDRNTERHTVRL